MNNIVVKKSEFGATAHMDSQMVRTICRLLNLGIIEFTAQEPGHYSFETAAGMLGPLFRYWQVTAKLVIREDRRNHFIVESSKDFHA